MLLHEILHYQKQKIGNIGLIRACTYGCLHIFYSLLLKPANFLVDFTQRILYTKYI